MYAFFLQPFLRGQSAFSFARLVARVQLALSSFGKLLCGFVLRTQAGSLGRRERLAVLISPCLASGQAADCFSGFVPPGGICLQEKFPYSKVQTAALWLSQYCCF